MKTLLVTIALLGLVAMPLVSAEEAKDVKLDLNGRLATGYVDTGSNGNNTPGAFVVPDAKVQLSAKLAEDISGVIRLNFDGCAANGADYAYIKLDNVVKKLAGDNTPVNPSITVGVFKMDFGEETFSNNPVENALVTNSVTDASGNDAGVQFKQDDIVKGLPLILGASFALFNGNGVENNNAKAYLVKASGQMKNNIGPGGLYFSLSYYGSGKLPVVPGAPDAALSVGGDVDGTAREWTRKVYELDVRYDLQEEGSAAKFDPSKSPLFSDSKGVFRLAYGNATDGEPIAGKTTYAYVMLDGIYNVNNKWYVAFRYSYNDKAVDRTPAQDGKWTRISIGGGHKLSENTIVKLEYSQNTEPKPKIDNDSISLIISTKW